MYGVNMDKCIYSVYTGRAFIVLFCALYKIVYFSLQRLKTKTINKLCFNQIHFHCTFEHNGLKYFITILI